MSLAELMSEVPDAVIEIRSATSPFGRDRIRPISLTLVDL